MIDFICCYESLNPVNLFRFIKHHFDFKVNHPEYFDPDGLVIFVGAQGTGKTLSAVNYIYQVMKRYPSSKLVTNVQLKEYPIVTFEDYCASELLGFPDPEEAPDEYKICVAIYEQDYLAYNRVFEFRDNDDFARYSNGDAGVVFFVDEIQLYLNSLESKNINMDVMTQISQQRKQRKHIVATSQVFGRLAKPLREQFSCVVLCKSYLFKSLQCTAILDRDSLDSDESTGTNLSGKVIRKFWWWRQPAMFDRYDTYRVISRTKFVSGSEQKDIYAPEKTVIKAGKE